MARKLSTSRGSTGLPDSAFCGIAVSGSAPPNAKLTTITLLVRRKSRLEISEKVFIGASLCFRRAQDGAENSGVCSTAAEIPAEPLFDLLECRVRRLSQQSLRAHDHSIRAIAALSRLNGMIMSAKALLTDVE